MLTFGTPRWNQYLILHAWIGGYAHWKNNAPIVDMNEYSNTPRDEMEWVQPRTKLADLLGIPHEYLTSSRMPADFCMRKTVVIPGFGEVTFRMYKQRKAPKGAGFIRFYMNCPECGKHVAVGRWWQYMDTHIEDQCGKCGKTYKYSKRRAHRRVCNG